MKTCTKSLAAAALALGSLAASPGAPPSTDAGTAHVAQATAGNEPSERLTAVQFDALLAEIATARKSVKSLRATFTQERTLTLLATTITSTGELSLTMPDRLRWELTSPDDIVYLVGPEGLSYRTRSSKATVPKAGATVAKALTDVRALLAGDLAALGERYVLEGLRTAHDVTLTGTAKDRVATVRTFTLTLDKNLVMPLAAAFTEGKRDAIALRFLNVRINVPVDPTSMRP